jgi:L-threonylcarbamoyladenylate synthase
MELEEFLQTELMTSPHSAIRAPGLMAVHYAPATVSMLCRGDELNGVIRDMIKANKRAGILAYNRKIMENNLLHVIAMPKHADDYAQVLYTALRELDRLQPDIILVEQPPATDAWWAINDRLAKATVPYQPRHS